MLPTDFQPMFNAWLDRVLSEPIPPSVTAFCFNLTKPTTIEVVGFDSYDGDDADWASDGAETFRPTVDDLILPAPEKPKDWAAVEEFARKLVYGYLDRPGTGGGRLKQSTAIALGFIDGELRRIWPR